MQHGIRAQLARYRDNVVTRGARRQQALQPAPHHTQLSSVTSEFLAPPQ
jgi:hypothetical protein